MVSRTGVFTKLASTFCLLLACPGALAVFDETAALQSLVGQWQGTLITGHGVQARQERVTLTLTLSGDQTRLMETIATPANPEGASALHLVIPEQHQGFRFVQIHSQWAWLLVTEQQLEFDHRPARLRTHLMRQFDNYQLRLELDYLDDRFEHWLSLRQGQFIRVSDGKIARSP